MVNLAANSASVGIGNGNDSAVKANGVQNNNNGQNGEDSLGTFDFLESPLVLNNGDSMGTSSISNGSNDIQSVSNGNGNGVAAVPVSGSNANATPGVVITMDSNSALPSRRCRVQLIRKFRRVNGKLVPIIRKPGELGYVPPKPIDLANSETENQTEGASDPKVNDIGPCAAAKAASDFTVSTTYADTLFEKTVKKVAQKIKPLTGGHVVKAKNKKGTSTSLCFLGGYYKTMPGAGKPMDEIIGEIVKKDREANKVKAAAAAAAIMSLAGNIGSAENANARK